MRSPFRYTKQEKRGIVILISLIAGTQLLVYRYSVSKPVAKGDRLLTVDSLAISLADSLDVSEKSAEPSEIRQFNPNFITDYKGYLLGLSPEELNRLQAFRKKGRFVGSSEEFRTVTGISDSLLSQISPYFRFPSFSRPRKKKQDRPEARPEAGDLNTASAEDLQAIYGIGPVLSDRIVRFRNRLGGFLIKEQLLDVYGLDEQVAKRIMNAFEIRNIPEVKKIHLNTAGLEEISGLVYLNRTLARRILAHRETHGRFDSIEQLTKIEEFPADRIERIKLYLAL